MRHDEIRTPGGLVLKQDKPIGDFRCAVRDDEFRLKMATGSGFRGEVWRANGTFGFCEEMQLEPVLAWFDEHNARPKEKMSEYSENVKKLEHIAKELGDEIKAQESNALEIEDLVSRLSDAREARAKCKAKIEGLQRLLPGHCSAVVGPLP